MKVSGFTIIRNAVKYDYPVCEAIRSILPLCDEMIVLVGDSDDGTLQLIESIGSDKIKIHHSVWDQSLREGGKVLAVETNKAFDLVSPDADWAFYIQADEVIHENDYDTIRQAMLRYKDDKRVEGLLFNYLHFYGNYKYIGDTRTWYRHEIRIIRNDKSIRSYCDAQGFRKNNLKLHVKPVDAWVYHYGWVKDPYHQKAKNRAFSKLYDQGSTDTIVVSKDDLYDYSKINSLTLFKGTHPQVMAERINRMDWEFEHDLNKKRFSIKDHIFYCYEKWTGRRLFEYRNFKIIK